MRDVAQDPLEALDVSRETIGRLESFVNILRKWNPAINLVSRKSLDDVWARHILDSAQLYLLAPSTAGIWLDLGSGGGFPGIVSAVIAREKRPEDRHVLVEVDQRKSTFLRQVIQALDLNATVHTVRIESLPSQHAGVITARALASLSQLCALAHPHLSAGGCCLFQKGAGHLDEIVEAKKTWHIDYDLCPSLTDADAVILRVKALAHV